MLFLLLACGGANQPATSSAETPTTTEPAALSCDAAAPKHCRTDADCACGTSKADGACAYGTAACIDTQKQCPDFCTGITGTMQLWCDAGTCAQRLGDAVQ